MEITVLDTIEPLAREWDELADRAGASPFLRPGWFETWWRAFARGRLEIAVLRRDGRLAGVAPLCRRRGTVLAVANVHSPCWGFLAEDAAAERELAEWLFARGPLHVSLCNLDRESSDHLELARAASAAGRRLLAVTMQRSPYIPVEGGWERFERDLSRKFVADLRRRRRALEREGMLTIEVADGSERLGGLLEEAFRIEPSGWKAQRGTAIVSKPDTRRFYSELAEWAASRGFLRLAFLRLDGRPIAFQYAIEDGSWYFLKGGVDPELKRFAPGKLLVHAMLERAFACGLGSFEFLGADEPWKNDWRPLHRDLLLQHSFRRTPAGLVWSSAIAGWRHYGLPLAKRTLSWAR